MGSGKDSLIFLTTQKTEQGSALSDGQYDQGVLAFIYPIATQANELRLFYRVLARAQVTHWIPSEPWLKAAVVLRPTPVGNIQQSIDLINSKLEILSNNFMNITDYNLTLDNEMGLRNIAWDLPFRLQLPIEKIVSLLSGDSVQQQIEMCFSLL